MSRKLSTLGDKVRQRRKKFGLSQDKLSKVAGVAYNTIVKIESGENRNPTLDTLKKIAKVLEVRLDDLIN